MNKDLYDGTTSILTVSSKKINHCGLITKKLFDLGIMSNVTPNQSVICDSNKCWIENGCSIILTGLNPKYINEKVWKPLNDKFDLSCAHLKISKQYQGCIYDFIKESNCPGNK
tara:strand:- start:440 stop:778 length:339 start_codon:yes stop_codon:yes gene_type:complete